MGAVGGCGLRAGGSRRRRCRAASRPGRIVVGEDRRLVEPETLNEESRLGDDTAAVGAPADDAQQRALADWASRRRSPATARSVAVGRQIGQRSGRETHRAAASPAPARRRRRRQRERRAAGAARMQLQRQRRVGDARAALHVARDGTGNSKVAPLPSGRDSRQSKVGEQAASDEQRPRAPRAAPAGRRAVARAVASTDYPGSLTTMKHERPPPRPPAAAAPMALEGVRVLDLSRVLAGPVVHADARRPRRRRDQGRAAGARRAAGRRRHPRLGPAVPAGRRRRGNRGSRVLPRHQPQQALADHRHRHARRMRSWCALSPKAAMCLSRTSRSATWPGTASTPRRCSRAIPGWSTARSPASARPGPTASVPATTTRSRPWAG